MKKIMMLLGAMLILCSTVVFASDISIEPYVDYDNGIIKANFTTEAKYNQALSVVLYKGTEMGDDLTKIIKIATVIADEDGKAYVEMKLPNDIQSGYYVISVYGGGVIDNSGSKVISYKDTTDQNTIIADVNAAVNTASVADIKTEIAKHSDILDIPANDAVYQQFILLRRDDFNSSFTSVNDIVEGMKKAKLLYDINNISSESALLSYLEGNANGLEIDITDPDYVSAKDKFATAFVKLKNNSSLTGAKSFESIYAQALSIGLVNNTDAKAMTAVIEKYADVIGISKSDYKANCVKYGEVEINKAFHGKNFGSCAEMVAAYNKRIENLSGGNGGGSSSGSSSSGSGGSSSGTVVYVNTPTDRAASAEFSDLSDASWAEESIKKMAKKGILSGYDDKSFKPNNNVTREEFISIIVRAFNMYDEEATCKFKDVSESDWSYKYIASAAKKKYISGFVDGNFGKGSYITRQDAATIIYRVRSASIQQFSTDEIDFTDGEEIAGYSKEAIAALANAGVINGFEDGSFKPNGSLTRAQAAKMIEILLDL